MKNGMHKKKWTEKKGNKTFTNIDNNRKKNYDLSDIDPVWQPNQGLTLKFPQRFIK